MFNESKTETTFDKVFQGGLVAVVLIVFLGATNIFFSVFSLGGDKARQRDITTMLARAEEILRALYRQRAAEEQIVGLREDWANICESHVHAAMSGIKWSRISLSDLCISIFVHSMSLLRPPSVVLPLSVILISKI
jgi:hypothetical protein